MLDVTEEMKELVKKAVKNMQFTETVVSCQVRNEMKLKYHRILTHNLTIPQMNSLVYRMKRSRIP